MTTGPGADEPKVSTPITAIRDPQRTAIHWRTRLDDQERHPYGQIFSPIIIRLGSEQVCTRHAHHSCMHAPGRELYAAFQRQVHFRSRSNENDVRTFSCRSIGKDITAKGNSSHNGWIAFQVKHRKALSREHQGYGPLLPANRDTPGGHCLIGICRPKDNHARDGTQAYQLLDGLMGWAVLAHADAVVRKDVNHRQGVHGR